MKKLRDVMAAYALHKYKHVLKFRVISQSLKQKLLSLLHIAGYNTKSDNMISVTVPD